MNAILFDMSAQKKKKFVSCWLERKKNLEHMVMNQKHELLKHNN